MKLPAHVLDLPAWPELADIVRCDTHDDRVPEPVFALLREVLPRCPNVKLVVLERVGGTLRTPADAMHFADDYRRVKRVVEEAHV